MSLELILSSIVLVSVSGSLFLLVLPPLLDVDWWKIDGKVAASRGFWVFVLFRLFVRGRKNRAHWIGGEELMKWDQAWQIRVAFVRRVRVSRLRRISSKISGMDRAWDWAEVGGGAIGVKKKKIRRKRREEEYELLEFSLGGFRGSRLGTIEPHHMYTVHVMAIFILAGLFGFWNVLDRHVWNYVEIVEMVVIGYVYTVVVMGKNKDSLLIENDPNSQREPGRSRQES